MSQVQEQDVVVSGALSALYASIRSQLDQVERILAEELGSDHPAVDEVIRHGISLGGKRLRPALVLLSGQAVGELTTDHITLAAVVEMIHTATLVHDDVLDEATLRRHGQTVNARWNNETSVLLGDFLFTHAFYLASTLESTFACRTIGRSTNIVCDGELRQTAAAGDLQLSAADYFAIIEAKTAELCACCCRLGAHYAGADRHTEDQLAEFGRELGIAFQISDDVLDLEGSESATGKSLGTDVAKRKMTLPLIHARDYLPPRGREQLLKQLNHQGRNGLGRLAGALETSGSVEFARNQASDFADRAASRLVGLPDSAACDALLAMSKFVVARSA